jgi:hypothetical protein
MKTNRIANVWQHGFEDRLIARIDARAIPQVLRASIGDRMRMR